MNPVTVKICMGTTCFVMGAAQLETLKEHLPEEVAPYVQILGAHCLDYCKNRNYGKAPFVEIDGQVLSEATLPEVLRAVTDRVRQS